MSTHNQTAIPVIKTDDPATGQIQQNINKIARNLDAKIKKSQIKISQTILIGEIKFATLSLLEFQNIAGTSWVLANGQSSVGTTYAILTGNKVVPNITLTGATAFVRVN